MVVFVSTKHHTEFLKLLLSLEGIESDICYGDMDPYARKINISKFRSGKIRLLIVTAVACRGMDIPLLDNVINWDYRPKPKIFVHRVGRVARNGRIGSAYSLVTSEDMPYFLDLHLFLSKHITAAPTEEEVFEDTNGVMAKIDQGIAMARLFMGGFPQSILDLVQDKIGEDMDLSADLAASQKTCKNAYHEYSRSKPLLSKESIRGVKDLPREGSHPMFKGVLEGNELNALAFTERLKSFR